MDKYIKGGEIKIETKNPLKAAEIISNAMKKAKKHGKVFVPYGKDGFRFIISFMANKEEVDSIYLCYAEKAIRLPLMKLEITKTRQKILDELFQKVYQLLKSQKMLKYREQWYINI